MENVDRRYSVEAGSELELATEQARVLSGVERPIESLLRAIQKEVALSKVSLSENQKATSEVAGKVAKVKFQIRQID